MRRLPVPTLLVTALTAACGSSPANTIDAPPPIDAAPVVDAEPPPPDAVILETCANEPLPTTATDPVTLSGTTNSLGLGGLTPVGGISLTAYDTADTVLDTDTSSMAQGTLGEFSLSVVSGGTPVNGYVGATGDGYVDAYVYPPIPVTDSQADLPALMIEPDTFGLLNSVLLGETQSASDGWIGVVVFDAAGNPVAGAQVGTSPGAGAVHYNSTGQNGTLPDANATVTDTDGVAYLVNVPAGPVSVYATKSGVRFRPTSLIARAGVITMTAVPDCAYGVAQ